MEAHSATAGRGIGAAPELREIPGPSAFGDDPRRFWELLWMISRNDFRQTYANTALGFMWTIVKPLVFFGVIFVVLRGILRFGEGIENYALILVMGLVLYQYFQEATVRAVRSISTREGMIRKMQFPRIIVPLSVSATATTTLLLNLLAVLPLFVALGVIPTVEWLLLIPLLAILVTFTTAVGLILSVAYVHFEDIDQAWGLFSRIMFYGSPVLFPLEVIPEPFDKVVAANPLAPLIELARQVTGINPDLEGPVEVAGPWLGLVVPFTIIVFCVAWSIPLFKREAPRVAELL